MSVQLPAIGRGTITLKRLYGSDNKGDIDINSSAVYIQGMIAKRQTNASGYVELAVADEDDTVAGLFGNHKFSTFYVAVIDEELAFTANSLTANLANANVSEVLVEYPNGTALTVTTDYAVTATNGIITRTSTGALGIAAVTAYVSYRYQSTEISGIDETLGSGKASLWEGPGEFETLVYDTSVQYALNSALYCQADGLLTTTNGGGTNIGRVTRPPSATDASMRFKMYGNF